MKLKYIKISNCNTYLLVEVVNILKEANILLKEKYNLKHWNNFTNIKFVENSLEDKEIYLVKNLDNESYVGTFQLKQKKDETKNIEYLEISKLATKASNIRRGIGTNILSFAEEYAKDNNITKLRVSVYEKSDFAIYFYKKNGFSEVATYNTKRFKLIVMEKIVR